MNTDQLTRLRSLFRVEYLSLLFFACIPFVDISVGYISRVIGIPSVIGQAYKALVVLLLLGVIVKRGVPSVKGYFVLATACFVFLSIVLHSLDSESVREDLVFYGRGPVLFSAAWLLLANIRTIAVRAIFYIYFQITWLTIGGSIFVSELLGISLATYDGEGEFSYGSKGFYSSPNEITLVYSLAWWFLVHKAPSAYRFIFYTAFTTVVLFMLGTKSGLALLVIFSVWKLLRFLKLNSVKLVLIFSFIAGSAILVAENVFLAVGPLLQGWERLSFFIEKDGAISALTGGRFLDLDRMLDIYQEFEFFQMIFGVGFNEYWYRLSGKSVESDFFDLLGGGGIVLVCWFYGIIINGFISSMKSSSNFANTQISVAIIAIMLYSVFVGHVAFAATPILTLALILAASGMDDNLRKTRIVPSRYDSPLNPTGLA